MPHGAIAKSAQTLGTLTFDPPAVAIFLCELSCFGE